MMVIARQGYNLMSKQARIMISNYLTLLLTTSEQDGYSGTEMVCVWLSDRRGFPAEPLGNFL